MAYLTDRVGEEEGVCSWGVANGDFFCAHKVRRLERGKNEHSKAMAAQRSRTHSVFSDVKYFYTARREQDLSPSMNGSLVLSN